VVPMTRVLSSVLKGHVESNKQTNIWDHTLSHLSSKHLLLPLAGLVSNLPDNIRSRYTYR
jgi:hypothetical protein